MPATTNDRSVAAGRADIMRPAPAVLHVEDSDRNRHVRRSLLESAGFRVIDASSSETAWIEIVSHHPEVVLTDIRLPDGDGFELTRRIKADPRVSDIGVVQISALFTESEHRVRGLDSGADAYLVEPIEPEELRAVLHAVIRARRTQTLLSTIIDGAPMLIAGADDDGLIAVFNASCEAVTGYRCEDVVGRPFVDTLIAAADRDRVREWFRDSRTAALAMPQETQWTTAAGEERLIEWRGFPVASPGGGEWILGIGQDITDRRHADTALRESEERLALALDKAQMGMWELDLVSGACDWSDQTGPLFGLPRGATSGGLTGLLQLIHPADRDAVLHAIDNATAESTFEVEFRTTWADGSVHWITGKGQVVPARDGSGLRLIGMGQDITARKHAEERLKEVNRHKDAFIATVAHELRQPLAPIVTALEIMKRRAGREAGERARGVIERQTQQMQRLVDDMVDAARIAQGKVALKRERIDLRSVVADTREAVQPLFEQRQQEFHVVDGGEPLLVNGDASRLRQVLSNLLVNAATYTGAGGQVWLAADREDDAVVIRVRDTGRGIEAALLPMLFDLFVQASSESGGLGLGLAVVKRLVEGHGGSVEAHSAGAGQGSEFIVRLPALGDIAD